MQTIRQPADGFVFCRAEPGSHGEGHAKNKTPVKLFALQGFAFALQGSPQRYHERSE